jgi:predicted naringenin-chalcone synthase
MLQAGVRPEEVECALVCSCTGYLCPDLATILVKELKLSRRVQRGALLGLGCAGALPTLQRAWDHARAHPGHRVLVVAVEICSATYFVDDSLETLVANAICSDGAAACLVTSDSGRGPRIMGFESLLDTSRQDLVGFGRREGRLRVILAPEIRDIAPSIVDQVLDGLLQPRNVQRSRIRHWLMHPGGRKVIDRVKEGLGLSEKDVAISRRVLSNFGNMSSATVMYVLRDALESECPQEGELGVLLALGPGFAAEAALLEW